MSAINTCDVATVAVWLGIYAGVSYGEGFGTHVFLTRREADEWLEYMAHQPGQARVEKHLLTAPIVRG